MRCLPLLALIFSFLWSGCAAPSTTSTDAEGNRRTLLNSERIELTFGSYGIEILEESDTLRVSNLYSLDGKRKICRTFAVVSYIHPMDARISEEHRRIAKGGSIGAVFKSTGWVVEKKHLYFGEIEVRPALARILELMGPLRTDELAVHVYVLSAGRANASVSYATIVEVHHPDYLTLEDLRALYSGDPALDAGLTDNIRDELEVALREMEEM